MFLGYVGGDAFTDRSRYFAVPGPVAPGQSVNIEVVMLAPSSGGRYVGKYQLQTAGRTFGDRLFIDVLVSEEETEVGWDVLSQEEELSSQPASAIATGNTSVDAGAGAAGAIAVEVDEEVEEEVSGANKVDVDQEAYLAKWGSQLLVLREMGFSNLEVVVPLLLQHFPDPATMNEQQRQDATQQVVMNLLGQSLQRA